MKAEKAQSSTGDAQDLPEHRRGLSRRKPDNVMTRLTARIIDREQEYRRSGLSGRGDSPDQRGRHGSLHGSVVYSKEGASKGEPFRTLEAEVQEADNDLIERIGLE